jgi:hypothetical protein
MVPGVCTTAITVMANQACALMPCARLPRCAPENLAPGPPPQLSLLGPRVADQVGVDDYRHACVPVLIGVSLLTIRKNEVGLGSVDSIA